MNMDMKRLSPRLMFFPLVFGFASLSVAAEPVLKIIQPYENQKLPYVTTSFVFGSITPATATLMINGVPVTPHKNGGFLTMIPFTEGAFQIQAAASDGVFTSTVTRNVSVASAPRPFPTDHGKIEPLSPRTRIVLRAEDDLEVSFQGAPGGVATFRIGNSSDWFPMRESIGSIPGIYRGVYRFKPNAEKENEDITFQLVRADKKKITQKAGAQITLQRRSVPRIVDLKERAILLTGPSTDLGYSLFLLEGVRLEVSGEWGDFYRVRLNDTDDGWIKKSGAVEQPGGTPPARSISRNIRIDATDASTTVEIPLQYRHAHRIEELTSPYRLRLTLYGVTPDTDRIRYKSSKAEVKELVWTQPSNDLAVFEIPLKQQQSWGYDARYEGTKLVLEIRHRPKTGLKGLRVAIDAGHSTQSYGTIGPWGNTEASVNLAAAKVVQKELERRGVDVIMIQDGTKDPSLQDRVDEAWAKKAQLYISFHCDATDDGVDPREVEGFSLHYYQPQSRGLAEALHRAYKDRSGMRDQGLWRSNLAVCRQTQMPSALFEMGFLVIPQIEEKLVSPSYQQTVAASVVEAITALLERP